MMRYRVISISQCGDNGMPQLAELESLDERSYGHRIKAYLFPHVGNMVSAIGVNDDFTLSEFCTLLRGEDGEISVENITEGTILEFPY